MAITITIVLFTNYTFNRDADYYNNSVLWLQLTKGNTSYISTMGA